MSGPTERLKILKRHLSDSLPVIVDKHLVSGTVANGQGTTGK